MNRLELEDQLVQYLDYRKSCNFEPTQAGMLNRFVRHYSSVYPNEPIRVVRVLEWITQDQHSPQMHANMLWSLRDFLRFIRITDPTTGIPDSHLLRSPGRSPPFIWTMEQLQSLLTEAKNVIPHRGLRAQAYVSVLGLMACSGLRIGEVLRLQVKDVHLNDEQPNLVIRETKFRKSRIVPLHPTATRRLTEYANRRSRHCYARHASTFFVNDRGHPLKQETLSHWFATVAKKLGLATSRGKRPTLHSLRHTFAVHRLTQWYLEQKPVSDLVPNLSVYLGHVSPADTYWYISSTPALLISASDRFGSYVAPGESI
jgi:integrase